MYRLEASISMITKERRTTSRYIAAILEPSGTSYTIEELASTRNDGLSAILEEPDGFGIPLNAAEIDPRRINMDSISRWLQDCDALHPSTCRPQPSEKLHKICLIDAESRTIVKYSSITADYLALSYVWGKGPIHNLAGAGVSGTLLDRNALPRTIEDALAFTKNLGKRYLWADLVCIEQDNQAKKQEQLGSMSDIYQGAYATIDVFSGASTDAGLPRNNSNVSPYRQLRCEVDGVTFVGIGPTLSSLAWDLPWANRAWTYQEAILSPKCIYISDYHVCMECNARTYCESLDESRSAVHWELTMRNSFMRELSPADQWGFAKSLVSKQKPCN